jgi:NTP pyrophosphatase (non-canonical NTP hydrolase)
MEREYTFQDLMSMTLKAMAAFDRVEQRPWTIEVTTIEVMKQIGDLAKHIMMMEHYYLPDRAQRAEYQTSVDNIGDELADILYCVMRIAEHYHIDWAAAHVRARRSEMRYAGQEPDF